MEYLPVASSSAIHPASLLPSYVHDPALVHMLAAKLSPPFVDYVIDCVAAAVQYVLERSWGSSGPYHLKQAPFVRFVDHVLRMSGCPVPTVLVALTYLDRAKHQMRITEGRWACERAFLGALILANKYTNDQNYDHRSWANASRLFAPRDVTRIEREMLSVLQYDLKVRNENIAAHYHAMVARGRHWGTAYSPAAPPPTSFPTPPPAYSRSPTTYSWSPSGSTTASASPTESPVLLTPDPYPPFARPAYPASLAPRCVPCADPYVLPLTASQCAAPPLAQELLWPQPRPPPCANEKCFGVGDAADLGLSVGVGIDVDVYAACDGVRPPDVTLPRLAEVVPPALLHPDPPFGAAYVLDARYGCPPALQDPAQPQKAVATIPHSFGDLTYVW